MRKSWNRRSKLAIDPPVSQLLPGHPPRTCATDVHLQPGQAPNDSKRFRYYVVLRTGPQINTRLVLAVRLGDIRLVDSRRDP